MRVRSRLFFRILSQAVISVALAIIGLSGVALAKSAVNQSAVHTSPQSAVSGRAVTITDARSTTITMPRNSRSASHSHSRSGNRLQVVEATVVNAGTQWITPKHPASVMVHAHGVRTVKPARITELAPGEQARVQIEIAKTESMPDGTAVQGQVVAAVHGGHNATRAVSLHVGIPKFKATAASLAKHQPPNWYNKAKFGIFIHWGVYSVPAWAPVGGNYAEWYWHSMHKKGSPTYKHHKKVYGEHFTYDDFIPRFTAKHFSPKKWVELFKGAGAKYFVLTSMHHEGFSLFDSKQTHRDAVEMGPHQDLVKELFQASRRYTPKLRPGLYYSLPEWYNPDYPGCCDGTFPGGPPHSPYTGKKLPYTGRIPVKNYVHDFQVPQMMQIIHDYKPRILWCDIGGPNDSRSVLAAYYNQALAHGNEVVVNDRCGIDHHDFTTPEYTSYHSIHKKKWEASRGLDPHSYGYNRNTPDDKYMSANEIVDTLVDIVSKNGNFLLDIGPKADGAIPKIMQKRLRQVGQWLHVNGQAIYGTTYWARTPQEGDLRFTVKQNDAFYITSLKRPGNKLVVTAPVPIRKRDTVTLLGNRGKPLHWEKKAGKLVIDVPRKAQARGRYAWVFKIDW